MRASNLRPTQIRRNSGSRLRPTLLCGHRSSKRWGSRSTEVVAGNAPAHGLRQLQEQRPLIGKDLAQRGAQAEVFEPVDLGKRSRAAGPERPFQRELAAAKALQVEVSLDGER